MYFESADHKYYLWIMVFIVSSNTTYDKIIKTNENTLRETCLWRTEGLKWRMGMGCMISFFLWSNIYYLLCDDNNIGAYASSLLCDDTNDCTFILEYVIIDM